MIRKKKERALLVYCPVFLDLRKLRELGMRFAAKCLIPSSRSDSCRCRS
jgi:hypothetical protein